MTSEYGFSTRRVNGRIVSRSADSVRNPEKMITALRTIFADRPDELFQGAEGVEAFCPRCGTRWWIDRPVFEGARGS